MIQCIHGRSQNVMHTWHKIQNTGKISNAATSQSYHFFFISIIVIKLLFQPILAGARGGYWVVIKLWAFILQT